MNGGTCCLIVTCIPCKHAHLPCTEHLYNLEVYCLLKTIICLASVAMTYSNDKSHTLYLYTHTNAHTQTEPYAEDRWGCFCQEGGREAGWRCCQFTCFYTCHFNSYKVEEGNILWGHLTMQKNQDRLYQGLFHPLSIKSGLVLVFHSLAIFLLFHSPAEFCGSCHSNNSTLHLDI